MKYTYLLLFTSFCLFAKTKETPEHITVKTGNNFIIELESNPTTGYSWVIKKMPTLKAKNKKMPLLKIIKDGFSKDTDNEHIVGAGGEQTWLIKALQPGTAKIILQYQRPWEKKPVQIKKYLVQVQD